MKRKKPEIMAPAGNYESLVSAINAGADAVYLGVNEFNMRATAKNFSIKELDKVVSYAHKRKVKIYLTVNTIIFENELSKVKEFIKKAKKANIDAIICWDMSVLSECKKQKIDAFLSTQASASNSYACEFYRKAGAKRITLARECTLEQINQIKNKTKAEIEIFIHGAMCVSISGRCFLSQNVFGKSANRGDCLQPCRREYEIKDIEEGHSFILGKDYILSPKDLCTMPFIEKILDLNVEALKIEGRARSPEYVAEVVSSYRKAVDLWYEKKLDEKSKKLLMKKLNSVYNRGFHSGFFLGKPINQWSKTYGSKSTHKKEFIGIVKNFYAKPSVAEVVIQSGKVRKGDKIIIIGPTTGTIKQKITSMQLNNQQTDKAVKGTSVGIKLEKTARKNDKVYVWKPRKD
ncbi:MAG: U32 family peptidase [Candidatus Nanoarchaeia archaeon]|nr:U32 family peptidase [Candidatus Nanoarchaeia archaeon]